METKELKITIPENHEIDWQESAKQEKIVFKKIDNKPRSWEEYCKNTTRGYYISSESEPTELIWSEGMDCDTDKNVLPSKELAKAFLAMMQLMSLRQAWIGDWEPDWDDCGSRKCCIACERNNVFKIHINNYIRRALSFPTEEMVIDFMNTFKDLLEVAKPLI